MADDDGRIAFPDAPRAALDRTLVELVEQANAVLETQGRLRALLRADQALVEELDLPVVLRRIVEAAVELAHAEYGALGVIAPEGGLEQFIYVGISPELAREIGHLPEGHGLLGALIQDPQPLRLPHLSSDARSVGFPANHPPMDSFLGVPIRVRGEVFGNLYLTNHRSGAFGTDDEELVVSLAATAGFAINNARLYAETRRRQEWTAAAAELVATILSGESADPVTLVAERLRELLPAARVEVRRTVDGAPVLESVADSQLAVALRSPSGADDILVASREAANRRFTPFEAELASDLTRQASLAVQLAAARASQQQMQLFEDRARIARDLHDLVIQQLFGAGLELQTILGSQSEPATVQRLAKTINAIDEAISQIRTVIFAISRRDESAPSIRHRLLDIAGECGASLPRTPAMSFSGAVDLLVRGDLADDVCAVAREALTNVVKHARAHTVSASLSVGGQRVVLEVTDDGIGLGPTARRSGLANLENRATARGGALSVESGVHGTRLTWTVPLPPGGTES